jgi:hypothetical protein
VRWLRAFLTILLLGGVIATSPGTHAEENDATVVLDALNPLLAQPGRSLEITGRVVNGRSTPIENAQVQLTISTRPLENRKQLADIFDGAEAPPSRVLTQTPLRVAIAPRTQGNFTIKQAFDRMGLTDEGTYVLGVQVTDAGRVIGEMRTFLPWFPPGSDVQPLSLVWLWPLSDWPARNAAGVLLNDQTPREISPGGRLAELVRIGAGFPVSWVVDPSLAQTVNAMTTGYEVKRDGVTVVGDRSAVAQQWLLDVRGVSDAPMWAIPYADVDASASRRAGLTTDVVRSITGASAIAGRALGEPVQGGLYWAPFGRLDTPTADLLASAGVNTVVLSAAALADEPTAASSRAALGTTFGALDAVLIDPQLASLLAAPQNTNNEVLVHRQRFLAETALIAQDEAAPRTVVVGPRNVRWAPTSRFISPLLRASQRAPWLQMQTLDAFLAQEAPGIPRDRTGYGERARNAELTAEYLAQVARVTNRVAVLAEVLDNPVGITEPFSSALLRAQSSAWRSEPETASSLLRSIRGEVNAEIAKVQVLTSGLVTFSGDSGIVPITIQNDLSQTVTVGVRLISEPAGRILSDDTTGITIESGKRSSIEVGARVIGGEVVNVTVQLLTPDGQRFGTPGKIEVGSTAYARAASWVVIGAFIALAIFVVVGVTRRIHKARRANAAAPSDTVST